MKLNTNRSDFKQYYIQIDDEPHTEWTPVTLPSEQKQLRDWVLLQGIIQEKLLSGRYKPKADRKIKLIDPVPAKVFSMPIMEEANV